jgi:hypothetical protein
LLVRDIQQALRKKLNAKPSGGKKHERLAVFDPERPTRKLCSVGFSRGGGSIDHEGLLRHIAVNELRLPSLRALKELVACPLDGPSALALIREGAEGADDHPTVPT